MSEAPLRLQPKSKQQTFRNRVYSGPVAGMNTQRKSTFKGIVHDPTLDHMSHKLKVRMVINERRKHENRKQKSLDREIIEKQEKEERLLKEDLSRNERVLVQANKHAELVRRAAKAASAAKSSGPDQFGKYKIYNFHNLPQGGRHTKRNRTKRNRTKRNRTHRK